MPLEQARRSFRNELKLVDKDIAQLVATLDESKGLDDVDRRKKLSDKVQGMIGKAYQCAIRLILDGDVD